MSQQLSFDLPVRTALGRDDFMVSPGNAVAVSLIEAWDNWPGGKLVLTGPPGADWRTPTFPIWQTDRSRSRMCHRSQRMPMR